MLIDFDVSKPFLMFQFGHDLPTSQAFACTLCETVSESTSKTPLIFVGVYSASNHFEKRRVIRGSWGKIFQQQGFKVMFFLGRPSETLSRRVKLEMLENQDMAA